jgi:3-methyl-2-oxobutanoate hydroxymethyltransferase
MRQKFYQSKIFLEKFKIKKYSIEIINKKKTILDIRTKFNKQEKLTMLTSYDYTSAYHVDKCDIDMILVGDSLNMVMLGNNDTSSVTMDEMILHCKSVSKGSKNSFLIGDMPFGSYEISPELALQNAFRFIKEGRMDAIKLEGDEIIASKVKHIVNAGIPVMGNKNMLTK